MDQKAVEKYSEIQEKLLADAEYRQLAAEYRTANAEFMNAMERMPSELRSVTENYLGVCIELHTKMLLLACAQ